MNRLKYLLLYRWRNRDALTGSFDIRRYHRDFDSTLHTSNRVALIVADVDDMKSVNDTYGVEFGDAVLRRIAKALMTRCRATGTLGPYRIGRHLISFKHVMSKRGGKLLSYSAKT